MRNLGSSSDSGNVYIRCNATDTATRFDEAAPHYLSEQGPHLKQGTAAMKNIFQTIRQWQRGNAAAKMLNRFDDHLLADIGIARGDISKAVHIFH